jgi:hypothetical protein
MVRTVIRAQVEKLGSVVWLSAFIRRSYDSYKALYFSELSSVICHLKKKEMTDYSTTESGSVFFLGLR